MNYQVKYSNTEVLPQNTTPNRFDVNQTAMTTPSLFYSAGAAETRAQPTSSKSNIILTNEGKSWHYTKKELRQYINWLLDREAELS